VITFSGLSSELGNKLLDTVADGALICDLDGTVLWANRAVQDVLGLAEDVGGTPLARWFNDPKSIEALFDQSGSHGSRAQSAVVSAAATGSDTLVSMHPDSEAGVALVVLRAFQSAVSSFDRAISFATRDPVTRFLNRDAFQERLGSTLRLNPCGAVLCANIDQFHTINEVYGSAEGDALLRTVGHRIKAATKGDKNIA